MLSFKYYKYYIRNKEENNLKRKIIVIFICFILFSTTFVSISAKNSTNESELNIQRDILFNRVIRLLMRIGHFPSLSACIIKDDEVVWAKGYGYYDIENRKPATKDTVYIACSISKTITGTAIMQLYEQGLFELDDDVNDYLPFNLRNPHFPDESITFRMLLSHSSSLNTDPESFYWLNFTEDPPISWYPYPWIEEYIVPGGGYYVSGIWNEDYPPGEPVMYSNANFVIISYLVEILSGDSFIDYCNEYIFEPLDMEASSFSQADFDIDDIAIPYHYFRGRYLHITDLEWGDAGIPSDKYYKMMHYPVGGLHTSVFDLSHFLIAHMNNGVYNGSRILDKETVEEMHKNQPPELGYGLAWYYSGTFYGRVFSGHEGDLPGYHNLMFLQHPEKDIGVIFFINGDRYTNLRILMTKMIRNILFFKANRLDNSKFSDNEDNNSFDFDYDFI